LDIFFIERVFRLQFPEQKLYHDINLLLTRSFYSSFGDTGATLDEFINNCKRSVPFNAERFFNDWIYSTNAIKLIIEGKSYNESKDYYKAFSTPTSAGKPYSRAITDQVIH